MLNDGKAFLRIEYAMVVNTKNPEDCYIVFIVPRNDGIILLGTFIEKDKEACELKVDSPAMVEMRQNCERFIPQLKNAQLDPEYPMAQGIRPLRKGDVRVQRESRDMDGDQAVSFMRTVTGSVAGLWHLAVLLKRFHSFEACNSNSRLLLRRWICARISSHICHRQLWGTIGMYVVLLFFQMYSE